MGVGIRLFRATPAKPAQREAQAKAQPQLAGTGIHRANPAQLARFDKSNNGTALCRVASNKYLCLNKRSKV